MKTKGRGRADKLTGKTYKQLLAEAIKKQPKGYGEYKHLIKS
jgi:hypothetical protein